MAVDLEAIRKRVQELSGQRKNSSVQLWKPTVGEYKIRGLPWKSTPDGMPFVERRFYYIGNNPGILAPSQFGKPDPINDLLRKLYSTGKPEDRLLAKKLQPKMRAYMPIIVRGQEDKGVLVWSFGKTVYQKLLGFFTDEDAGDILDPEGGFDLKVTITQAQGKQFMDTDVNFRPKSTKLSDDPEVAKKWLEAVPNIDDMYRQKTPQEIEKILNDWLAGGGADDNSDGSSRGDKPQDELDKLVDEVKAEVKPSTPAAAAAKVESKPNGRGRGGKKQEADLDAADEAPAGKKTDLDAAFAELTKDD